jgi:hypothetical protein
MDLQNKLIEYLSLLTKNITTLNDSQNVILNKKIKQKLKELDDDNTNLGKNIMNDIQEIEQLLEDMKTKVDDIFTLISEEEVIAEKKGLELLKKQQLMENIRKGLLETAKEEGRLKKEAEKIAAEEKIKQEAEIAAENENMGASESETTQYNNDVNDMNKQKEELNVMENEEINKHTYDETEKIKQNSDNYNRDEIYAKHLLEQADYSMKNYFNKNFFNQIFENAKIVLGASNKYREYIHNILNIAYLLNEEHYNEYIQDIKNNPTEKSNVEFLNNFNEIKHAKLNEVNKIIDKCNNVIVSGSKLDEKEKKILYNITSLLDYNIDAGIDNYFASCNHLINKIYSQYFVKKNICYEFIFEYIKKYIIKLCIHYLTKHNKYPKLIQLYNERIYNAIEFNCDDNYIELINTYYNVYSENYYKNKNDPNITFAVNFVLNSIQKHAYKCSLEYLKNHKTIIKLADNDIEIIKKIINKENDLCMILNEFESINTTLSNIVGNIEEHQYNNIDNTTLENAIKIILIPIHLNIQKCHRRGGKKTKRNKKYNKKTRRNHK